MKVTKLNSSRLLLEFTTKREMCLTMFRVSEFAEGNDLAKGKMFNINSFLESYLDEDGYLKYFNYWDGFNFSLNQFNDWINTERHLFPREFELFKTIQKCNMEDNSYIISMVEGDDITLRHELAHAVFFDNKDYRATVYGMIYNNVDQEERKKFADHLISMNYNEDVIIDEMQAYMVAFDREEFEKEFPTVDLSKMEKHIKVLGMLFDEYNKITA